MIDMNETKYCANCGAEIDAKAVICVKCGVKQAGTQKNVKNAGVAAILSFFFTGAGQIYNGDITKGLCLIIIQIINIILIFFAIGIVTYLITWTYGIYDAYERATKINEEI